MGLNIISSILLLKKINLIDYKSKINEYVTKRRSERQGAQGKSCSSRKDIDNEKRREEGKPDGELQHENFNRLLKILSCSVMVEDRYCQARSAHGCCCLHGPYLNSRFTLFFSYIIGQGFNC